MTSPSRPYTPHAYQALAINHLCTNPRANLFMSPGMGKTVAALTALDAVALTGDVFPALVIGPLRVANSVWHREVEKWAHLKGLRVVRVLGTASERIAALRTPADIYTIHYGLLAWLHDTLKDAVWPFRTVVSDESTRLKGARCSFQKSKTGKVFLRTGGGTNASALARYAPRTERWINLTGTPAPNGLTDLWGQHWFIDFGEALGNSYDAFTKRWFFQRRGTSAEQAVFLPHDHSLKEITQRIAPVTLSLDAYDWFDVQRPREVDITIELPDRLMKEYRKLHRDAVLELSKETVITAVNAGAITNKCLQYASGHLYDEDGSAHWIHDEKLQALESLVENLGGRPLLVAYNFKSDRDRILQKFKFAELLPSGTKQQDVEDRWNEGRIPMLVVHPASAGHGLNLQHGGHELCIYGPNWDLELYQQLIERIGPVRQMQAGYDRLVSVYRLIVKGSFDRIVVDRCSSKASLQDAITAAVRAEE